ncbi:beta-1,3-galactosyltransferase 5-like [Homarus americanus]|uniref:beta-1,3-galactosyltransferase 5-like n=1 Tax=Homarus americanus TaxID=6706 RepID=UPI001C47EF0B|nr:beta-1,3-galactosyltransferase 5-like [Homarus americanus]
MYRLVAPFTLHIYKSCVTCRRVVLLLPCVVLLVLLAVSLHLNLLPSSFTLLVTRHHDTTCSDVPPSAHNALDFRSADSQPQFLIEEPDFCRKRPNLTIVAYVHSSISSVMKRMETRTTWASVGVHDEGVKMGVVFMVGQAKNSYESKIIRDESRRFGDIVQGNYTDAYHLLSHKALASLQWVLKHCPHVPWTLHADDDILIDTFFLNKFLKHNATTDSFICYNWKSSKIRRDGRWCVRSEEFPDLNYPSYCAGGAWVIATHLGSRLLHAAKTARFLWVDDVYITGVLAQPAGVGRSMKHNKYFRLEGIDEEELGDKIFWFEPNKPRMTWWLKLLTHYKHFFTVFPS